LEGISAGIFSNCVLLIIIKMYSIFYYNKDRVKTC
jgi:hypothetical protein